MDVDVSKRCISLRLIIPAFLALFLLTAVPTDVVAQNNTATSAVAQSPALVPNNEIESFLFRVNSDVKNKIAALGSELIQDLPIPILFGGSVGDFQDTWREARAGGRVHEGTDIIVPHGELVVSPTEAVVTEIGYDIRGGNFVVTANPGGEQFYFAHLDRAAENLSEGDVLQPGDLIGYAGNTGNARGKPSHLHLGIYYNEIPRNPFPRLTREFSLEEKRAALERIIAAHAIAPGEKNTGVRFLQRYLIHLDTGSHAKELAKIGVTGYFGILTNNALAEYQETSTTPTLINAHIMANENLYDVPAPAVETTETPMPYSSALRIQNDLGIGSNGEEVAWLQSFLIHADAGIHARALAHAGVTGYFGHLTKNALAEYQLAIGIQPSSGYFGPLTRASLHTLGGN
ncbi:MAG: peptidase M23B [Parcubacteria group bacterium Gr01-1014_70]|nr:MAG: peptidase M23B [Parcubacteria group bacterium Gr01-1014_70]